MILYIRGTEIERQVGQHSVWIYGLVAASRNKRGINPNMENMGGK